jgi:hypothetical protein
VHFVSFAMFSQVIRGSFAFGIIYRILESEAFRLIAAHP